MKVGLNSFHFAQMKESEINPKVIKKAPLIPTIVNEIL
jgi:hypothetical protein